MVAHVAELCRVFTSQCCAMIKIRSPAFFSSSSSPSAPFQTPKSESENKRHHRACSSSFARPFQTPKSESENKRHHRACSSSFASLFRLRSRSPKIEDTTERAAEH
eukprot:scaffold104612_cov60-Phaeocystis_antarctica.AAC.1